MEGFRRFPDTTSFRLQQPPLPETPAGSSSQNTIGETHFYETLEAAFNGLKVSSFCPQPRLSSYGGERSNGYSPKYALNYDHAPGGDDGVLFDLNNNGGLWNVGLEDCWVESNGFVSNNPNQHSSMAALRGKTLSLAKDQLGCRLLQSELVAAPSKDLIDLMFMELLDHVGSLMLDQNGSHVVQKLIEVISEEQRTRMILMLTIKKDLQLVCVSLHAVGARCVQKLLKNVTTREQVSLIMAALSPYAAALSRNANGQHVIQHCLERFSVEDNQDLLHVVAANCYRIATDKSGCCVMQKCVELSNGEIRELLIATIIEEALALAVDRYGNYVVQHILGLRIPQVTENLLRRLQGSYMVLSSNKFGSNVVEKCLLESSEEQSSQILSELLTDANVSVLLMHPYGNYVMQTALSVSKGIHHQFLVRLVQQNSPILSLNPFGKKVLAWRDRRRLQHM